MKTAKIEKIMEVKERTWDYWTTYYISLKMDNWDMITLGKKSKDAFKEWDTVSYESYQKDWKIKYKEVKENNFRPKPTYNPEATNKGAMVWMAMKLAFEQLYDKTNYNEVIQLATRIFEDAMEIYENYGKKSESKIEDSTENDDLPF